MLKNKSMYGDAKIVSRFSRFIFPFATYYDCSRKTGFSILSYISKKTSVISRNIRGRRLAWRVDNKP